MTDEQLATARRLLTDSFRLTYPTVEVRLTRQGAARLCLGWDAWQLPEADRAAAWRLLGQLWQAACEEVKLDVAELDLVLAETAALKLPDGLSRGSRGGDSR